jgi:hypothetical protein
MDCYRASTTSTSSAKQNLKSSFQVAATNTSSTRTSSYLTGGFSPKSNLTGTNKAKQSQTQSIPAPLHLPNTPLLTERLQTRAQLSKNENKQQQQNITKSLDPMEALIRRLDALKHLQIKTTSIEAKFYEELYLLDCKYSKRMRPLNDMRRRIVNGEYEPTDEECQSTKQQKIMQISSKGDSSVNQDELERKKTICKEIISLFEADKKNMKESRSDFLRGLPGFWLRVFKRVGLISQMIEVADEAILKHLIDVEVELCDKKPYNFALKFFFSPNEYFTNSVLTKTYEFVIEQYDQKPFVFEGPEIQCSCGCKINWKKGKKGINKLNTDNQKDSNKIQSSSSSSFFDYFDNLDKSCLTGEEDAELAIDFEIGYTFKEKVIPRAVLYYMDEIQDESDEYQIELDDSDQESSKINK